MNVVVTSFGSHGDFNPLLAIASALVRRGVTVTFVANPFYESRVKSTGSRFVGAGNYLTSSPSSKPTRVTSISARVRWRFGRNLSYQAFDRYYLIVRDTIYEVGATSVVSHFASYGGAWAAAETESRSVIVTTSSSAWLSRHQPVVFANWRAPRIVQGALTTAIRGISWIVLRQALRRLAVEIGAPTVDIMRVAELNLGIWPEWFRPPASDDPPRSRMCGFVFDKVDASEPLPANVESFLAAGVQTWP